MGNVDNIRLSKSHFEYDSILFQFIFYFSVSLNIIKYKHKNKENMIYFIHL